VTSIPSAERPPRRIASVVGLIFALVIPAFLSAGGPTGEIPTDVNAVATVLISEAATWSLTLIVLAIVLFAERRRLTSIGLGIPTWPAIRTGILMTVLLLVLAMGAGAIVQAAGGLPRNGGDQVSLVMGLPIWLQLFAAVSAGFTEEILFRGYAIERMTELTGSRWLGAIIPIIVFGAIHAPFWGIGHAIVAGMSGFWLTLIYLWRRNLWTNITAHALLDALVFVSVDILAAAGATAG
jgi:membrane protease YdiL (CAAX protease family)